MSNYNIDELADPIIEEAKRLFATRPVEEHAFISRALRMAMILISCSPMLYESLYQQITNNQEKANHVTY